jgi:hypothetical protein
MICDVSEPSGRGLSPSRGVAGTFVRTSFQISIGSCTSTIHSSSTSWAGRTQYQDGKLRVGLPGAARRRRLPVFMLPHTRLKSPTRSVIDHKTSSFRFSTHNTRRLFLTQKLPRYQFDSNKPFSPSRHAKSSPWRPSKPLRKRGQSPPPKSASSATSSAK